MAADAAADLDILIQQLERVIANPEAAVAAGSKRHQVLQLARAAAVAIEEPFETLQRVGYSPLPLITTRIAQEHGIFATLVASKEPVSFAALQDASRLEAGVLESILDYMCTQRMANEVVPGCFTPTRLSNLMTLPLFRDAVTHFHDTRLPGLAALNSVLRQPGAKLNAFKAGHRTDQDFYTWLSTHPVHDRAFHRYMEAQFASLPTWLDVVDFEADFGNDLAPSDVAFVDVGGGNGQQCALLKNKFPGLQGRIILQDRPHVLQTALSVENMEKMSHDYLTEQPVKTPGHGSRSTIVIDEKALPDTKHTWRTPGVEYTAALGICMKVLFDAQERREAQWRELLAQAGLVIQDIRRFTRFEDSAIIVTKAP
ncbi:O-methyltransferase, family 2 [Metarhizium album ARSEF 1941]|uniref:O-methyltransferase, family 2 n=1 Tax=Metarhizium album (strain ARSEF 1941) TaxID=1081103 RepID=A0A0B2X7T7_METAS|nr:O-methyltransferase, family 2 [Metarhizium album ARSEF 1941]KHO01575.1 O-methyltransferase, family 2 [Metarhizium album ARSEF 1941]